MINAVYFINGISGVTLLSRLYRRITIDEQLIGGFLQALSQFIKELIKDGESEIEERLRKADIRGVVETEVREIHLRGYDLIYEMRHPIVVVALIDEKDDALQVRSALKVLLERFMENYRNTIETPIIDKYQEFIPIVDEVLKNGKVGLIFPVKKGKASENILAKMGYITEDESKVLKLCNGKLTVDEIAKELNMAVRDVWKIFESLKRKGLLELKHYDEVEV